MVLEEILKHDETFRYQLLSRMVEDCNYYLGYGNRNAKDLWANDEWEQIEIMQALYESFPPEKKPEWLTMSPDSQCIPHTRASIVSVEPVRLAKRAV